MGEKMNDQEKEEYWRGIDNEELCDEKQCWQVIK